MAAFCVVAAIRVLLYSAAFPFFNNVDELQHFDLVLKYTHGEVPRKLEAVSPETRRYAALYASPEYFQSAQQFPGGRVPYPNWTVPEHARAVLATVPNQPALVNTESSQAPLYYALAALWFRAGQMFGVEGGSRLYWIRFLNVLLMAGLVWLGYAATKICFPEDGLVVLGVPGLLAILPQDSFYSIQNDVLSPLAFGLAFIGIVQWLRSGQPGARLSVLTGLALAATGLVKISNLPLLAVAGLAIALGTWRRFRPGTLRSRGKDLAWLVLCAGLPLAGWFYWNLHNFGDFSASAAKIRELGWTYKPVVEWWRHPLFTPGGLFYFWSQLMARFWRGEFVWGLEPLASPVADAFYWISSLVLTVAAVTSLFPKIVKADEDQRRVLLLCASSFFGSVGYLALLSLAFDFGNCMYPSRAEPFFTSGRLLLGALIPFLILYLYGLSWAARNWKWAKVGIWLVLGTAVYCSTLQMDADQVAFSSEFNWFHLTPSSRAFNPGIAGRIDSWRAAGVIAER